MIRGGAADQNMFDHVDSSTMSETLKKAFFNVVLELVPYAFSISLEGTLGITIDGKQMLFLHFSDTVNKHSEDDAVGAMRSLPPHPKRNSVSSKRSFGDALNRTSGVHPKVKSNCRSNGDAKHSLLLSNANPIQSATEDVLVVQSNQSEYLTVAEACSEFSVEKSTAARRKNRPAKCPTDGVTVFRNVTSNHVSSVCPVTGEEENEVSPGQLEVLDFSTHGMVESFKRNAPDYSAATNDVPKSSGFQACPVDDEPESAAPTKTRNQQDQTLLRQLLLNNTKSKKAKSSKRRLSGSDDDAGKKACVEASSSTSENLKGGSSGLTGQESDACASWTNHRSAASKRTEGRSTDDSGGERRANPDSILCRLLTSGVNLYDTTEVERLRQASTNRQEVAVDWDAGQHIAGQLGNAVDDVVLTNVKTKWEPCLRTEEFINITPVETTDKTGEFIDITPVETTEDDALCFQSNIQRPVLNSPPGQLSRTGTGPPLRSLPDAVIIVSPLQANVAEQCLTIVKKERDDSVDARRTLHDSAGAKFPNGARTKENLYQTCSAKSSDFGK